MAVSFRSAGDPSGMGRATGSMGPSGESFLDDLVPIVAVVAASIVIVVSLIILAVALRKPIQGWLRGREVLKPGFGEATSGVQSSYARSSASSAVSNATGSSGTGGSGTMVPSQQHNSYDILIH